jgi:hypothetical protein
MSTVVQKAVASCGSPVTVCGSLGFGFGITVPAASCGYGAGVSIGFSGVPGIIPADAAAASCPVDPVESAIAAVVSSCNTACAGVGNFNACFCPCYVSGLVADGVVWAANIACVPG